MKKIYIAPMEGVTGHIFRRAYHRHINQEIEKYFTPFISPNKNQCMSNREKKDILPEDNPGMRIVPQILTKDAERFVDTAKELMNYGYKEINLNLGCPSATVVSKKKGAGMLGELSMLERFLDKIYDTCPASVSIKTRLGIEREEEWWPLFQLFCKFPLAELIVHVRLLQDFYSGPVRPHCFYEAMSQAPFSMIYNGDIFSVEDAEGVETETIMLGRGILRNPMLSCEIQGIKEGDLRGFHEQLLQDYRNEMSGETPTLHKMKELWSHLITSFPDATKEYKAIRKSKTIAEYEVAVSRILDS
ncbi:tRNA-dihydrouridine synthase [Lachnospiraceae bacterium XBB1006]|nr:tRNA-dihydrouridine synthase [Lachnospiraceae bacterium XBB1006]